MVKRVSFLLLLCISLDFSILNAQDLFCYPPGHFSFNLPSGWKIIPNKVVEEYAEELIKKSKTLSKPKYDLVFNRVNASRPFEYPYFVITNWKQKVNKAIIEEWISSAQQITKKAMTKQNLREFFPETLIRQPAYDDNKHILTYSVEFKLKGFEGKDTYGTMIISLFVIDHRGQN